MYRVKEGCPGCGACENVCPVDAIIPGSGLALKITEGCIDCGLCAGSCPVGLIEKAEQAGEVQGSTITSGEHEEGGDLSD